MKKWLDYFPVGTAKLAYHNEDHTLRVAHVARKLCTLTGTRATDVVRAALWHDVIYVPGASDNEERSAQALLESCPRATESARMIRSTRVSDHISSDVTFEKDPGLSILLDADLVSLADPWEQFIQTQLNILSEHGSCDLGRSSAFLVQFLNKPRIFRSPGAGEFEDVARKNIFDLCTFYPYA